MPLISAIVLAGCASAPRSTPQPTIPPVHVLADGPEVISETPASSWWHLYEDPGLDAAVSEALRNNRDLRVAAARLLEANSILSETRTQLTPTTQFAAGVGEGSTLQDQLVAASQGFDHIRTGPRFDLGGQVSWEPDFFGRLRSTIKAVSAEAQASAALEDGVRVAVAAGVTGAWLEACGYAHSDEVANRSLALAEQGRELNQKLLQAGAALPVDVARSDALVAQARAALPPLEARRHSALVELAVLMGHVPDEPPARAAACTTLPTIEAALPVGDGVTLLRRRPDILAAEQQLTASTARIGVAVADLYPRISLSGSADDSSPTAGALGTRNNVVWRVGPLLTWSFPNTGAARARIRWAYAGEVAALAHLDATILDALKDVNEAAENYRAVLARQAALRDAAMHTGQADHLLQLQRAAGDATALELLDAQRADVEAQAALAAADAEVAQSQVALFKALGGGWERAPPVNLPSLQRSVSTATTTIYKAD